MDDFKMKLVQIIFHIVYFSKKAKLFFWVPILTVLFVFLLNLYSNGKKEVLFHADYQFISTMNQSTGLEGLFTSIPSLFGSSSSEGSSNDQRVIDLLFTFNITKDVVQNKIDSTAKRHLIDLYPELGLKDFKQNETIKRLRDFFELKPIISYDFSPSGIIIFKAETRSEYLSKSLVSAYYNSITEFYIRSSYGPKKESFEKVKKMTDSLQQALQSVEYRIARNEDTRYNVVKRTAVLKQTTLMREQVILQTKYTQAVQNLELARFALYNSKSSFETVQEPISPILRTGPMPRRKLILTSIVIGLILGLFLVALIVSFREFVSPAIREYKIMNKEK